MCGRLSLLNFCRPFQISNLSGRLHNFCGPIQFRNPNPDEPNPLSLFATRVIKITLTAIIILSLLTAIVMPFFSLTELIKNHTIFYITTAQALIVTPIAAGIIHYLNKKKVLVVPLTPPPSPKKKKGEGSSSFPNNPFNLNSGRGFSFNDDLFSTNIPITNN